MKHTKNISRPDFNSARPLSAAELNAILFDDTHTVLTAELLAKDLP